MPSPAFRSGTSASVRNPRGRRQRFSSVGPRRSHCQPPPLGIHGGSEIWIGTEPSKPENRRGICKTRALRHQCRAVVGWRCDRLGPTRWASVRNRVGGSARIAVPSPAFRSGTSASVRNPRGRRQRFRASVPGGRIANPPPLGIHGGSEIWIGTEPSKPENRRGICKTSALRHQCRAVVGWQCDRLGPTRWASVRNRAEGSARIAVPSPAFRSGTSA